MVYFFKTNNTRPVGYNKEIKDAIELQELDLRSLASLLGVDEGKCLRELTMDKEMPKIKKMGWLSAIFKRRFDNLTQWQIYIRKLIEDRGPDWLEEPPLIEGSTRHDHHRISEINKSFYSNRQKEAADAQQN